VAREIEKLGRRAAAFPVDLAVPEEVERLADAVLAATPRLHVLVNNAALLWGAPTLER
jgi:NAD(P)-dependent dehydrogenase (short-subunit alcohol dehydrogenase family)